MITAILTFHFASADGLLGPSDCRIAETLERRFGECSRSKNPLGIPKTFWAFQEHFGPGPGPMGPYIGPKIGPYFRPSVA